ncbi:TetR/AcrR family transcriptional regulator [Kineococcus gypseus]|uniref:TetR/AcrR family transcriptional regulator n=1 Tax=Kineococcus gypseus TaxID=1637102 RepID=UPI003D7E5932
MSFDPDLALEAAMRTFWQAGYEGASIAVLTAAMGINRRSMYETFGAKEQLFAVAVRRYLAGPGAFPAHALRQPTAFAVCSAFLHGAARAYTCEDTPRGCLLTRAALAAGPQAGGACEHLAALRRQAQQELQERLERAGELGELTTGASAEDLARYLVIVGQGMSVQAVGGASREDLRAVADGVLSHLPVLPPQEPPVGHLRVEDLKLEDPRVEDLRAEPLEDLSVSALADEPTS